MLTRVHQSLFPENTYHTHHLLLQCYISGSKNSLPNSSKKGVLLDTNMALRASFWNPSPPSSSAATTTGPAPWTSSSSSTCVDVPTLEFYAAAHPFHPFLCDFFCKRPFSTFHFPLFPTHCFENSCLLQRLPEACRNEVPRLFKASIPVKQQFKLSSLYNSSNYFTTLTM